MRGFFYHAPWFGIQHWVCICRLTMTVILEIIIWVSYLAPSIWGLWIAAMALLLCHSCKGDLPTYFVCNAATKIWTILPKPDYGFHSLALACEPCRSHRCSVLGFKVDKSFTDKIEILVLFSSQTGRRVEKRMSWGSEMDSYFHRHVVLNGIISSISI